MHTKETLRDPHAQLPSGEVPGEGRIAEGASEQESPDTPEGRETREDMILTWRQFLDANQGRRGHRLFIKESTPEGEQYRVRPPEEMANIEGFLGDAVRDFTKHYREALTRLEELVALENERKGGLVSGDAKDLFEQFGKDYEQLWSRKDIVERLHEEEEGEGRDIVFEGFDEHGEAEQAIRELYASNPQWLTQNVRGIKLTELPKDSPKFDMVAGAEERTIESAQQDLEEGGTMLELEVPSGASTEDIKRMVIRALARHNDWLGSAKLSLPERARFLEDVRTYATSSERLTREELAQKGITGTPGAKHRPWDNEHTGRYHDVSEYWVMLNEYFDLNPAEFQKEREDEYNMVAEWRNRLMLSHDELARMEGGTEDDTADEVGEGDTVAEPKAEPAPSVAPPERG